MSQQKEVCVAGIGAEMQDIVVNAAVRGSTDVAVGELVCFALKDYLQIAVSPQTDPGMPTSLLANVVRNYTSTNTTAAIWAVALDAVGASTSTATSTDLPRLGRFLVQGRCKALVNHSTGNTAWVRGAPLVASYATSGGVKQGYLDALGQGSNTSTATAKFIGIALEGSAGLTFTGGGQTSVGALADVVFDGLNGFGGRANGFVTVT